MNKQSIGIKKSTLALASAMLINNPVFAETLQVGWSDRSSNEDGFMIERRLLDNNIFEKISTLSANSNTFTDSDVLNDETYCYRIIAYNQAGESPSEEQCLAVTGNDDGESYDDSGSYDESESEVVIPKKSSTPKTSTYSYTDISISHEFISKPTMIELADKKLYSFKSDETYNESYTDSSVYNANFSLENGKTLDLDRDYFSFQQEGEELTNGYVSMAFKSTNNLTFDMQSNDTLQTATLYMQAGVWSNEAASVVVTVGETEYYVTISKGYSWEYIAIDITFDGTVPVSITTDSDQGGYSTLMFAGIVINEATTIEYAEEVEPVQYASLLSSEINTGLSIDVTDVKFVTQGMQKGNEDFSDATVENISYYGDTRYYNNGYYFNNENGESYNGYTWMRWNENNGITAKLQSGESQINTVTLYFSAGAWTNGTAQIAIVLNGQTEFIELNAGYTWERTKVVIEFEGELNIDIHPVTTITGHSALNFGGLTIE